MTNESHESDRKQVPVGADLIIPIAGIALAIYYFTTIIDSAWTAKVTFYLVGVTLVVLALIFIAKAVGKLMAGEARLSFASLMEPPEIMPTRATLLVLTLAAIIVMPYIGFTLTSIIYLAA
ncbi:MAG: hypothetical protein RLZ98_2331, partial [Pseudomonadota bacterium]